MEACLRRSAVFIYLSGCVRLCACGENDIFILFYLIKLLENYEMKLDF